MARAFPFKRLLKFIVVAVLAVMLFGFVLLKIIERSPEQLKVGFESYLTQIAGYPADIGTLNHVRFVPDIVMDVSDIRFWAIDDPNHAVITVDHAIISMPLWSVMIGMPRFSRLSLDSLSVEKSVTGIADIGIDSIAIRPEPPELAVEGAIGGMAVKATFPLKASKDTYRIAPPPVRIGLSVEGGRTSGDVFVDMTRDEFGATASFPSYRARDMRAIQQLLEAALADEGERTLPVQVHIESLEGAAGAITIPALRYENGRLQPLECFYNNQGRAQANPHPCAAYFEEPETDETP